MAWLCRSLPRSPSSIQTITGVVNLCPQKMHLHVICTVQRHAGPFAYIRMPHYHDCVSAFSPTTPQPTQGTVIQVLSNGWNCPTGEVRPPLRGIPVTSRRIALAVPVNASLILSQLNRSWHGHESQKDATACYMYTTEVCSAFCVSLLCRITMHVLSIFISQVCLG